ncbi:winged helix-turn-helix transcriptional regulator [Histidinibacterium lentulum]|uniref:Transcriptional regulator n=1 Tax=Histidinibacterium lentulum TaxID=2480588 RepID=A0A3N2R8B0_9RHOB|nr:helix-turn-helix domain-containing protein [Histidinibacterium lentulum]ROU03675.1 transcriptional regulator [Histidinibacterium lentulum]
MEIPCPMRIATETMGGRWRPGILWRLMDGPMRYGELRRGMPWISEKILIRHLRDLEAAGLILRTDHGTQPPQVDYRLTEAGQTLGPVLTAMAAWGAGRSAAGAERLGA